MDRDKLFEEAYKVYRVIRHPLRKRMLEYLTDKEVSVSKIYAHFKMEQSVCSGHLRLLREVLAVKTRRDKKNIYYTTNEVRMLQLKHFSEQLVHGMNNKV